MVETIGKRLCQARLAKGLSIDEAAHATKMRPDKILALENDDYSRFGNNAYAKGFLQIYGKFLGVDTSDQFRELDSPRQINVNDYQYLNSAPAPAPAPMRVERHQAGPPSVVPLLVFMGVFAIAIFAFWIFVNYQRIDPNTSKKATTSEASAPAAPASSSSSKYPAVSATPARAERPIAAPEEKPKPASPGVPGTKPAFALPPSQVASATPASPAAINGVEVRRAEPVRASNVAKPGEPLSPSNGTIEVVVEPIKKTWVKVRKGTPDSPPIFEDYLYPGDPPLKLPRGAKFFIEVRDQTAVQIRRNGTPIAYQAPGITIQ